MAIDSAVPVLGIVARRSNSGKTTLIEKLIPVLRAMDIRVSVIKHIHHKFDLDTPGKDSYRFREAGANQVMVASDRRWALLEENPVQQETPDIQRLIQQMDLSCVELLLVEGMKELMIPKLEVSLTGESADLLCWDDPGIIGLVSGRDDIELPGLPVPRFEINDVQAIAGFIHAWLGHGVG